MNISWQWLNELVDLQDITPENLAEQLTLASFEVESICLLYTSPSPRD